jgi:hypothetical protein
MSRQFPFPHALKPRPLASIDLFVEEYVKHDELNPSITEWPSRLQPDAIT